MADENRTEQAPVKKVTKEEIENTEGLPPAKPSEDEQKGKQRGEKLQNTLNDIGAVFDFITGRFRGIRGTRDGVGVDDDPPERSAESPTQVAGIPLNTLLGIGLTAGLVYAVASRK